MEKNNGGGLRKHGGVEGGTSMKVRIRKRKDKHVHHRFPKGKNFSGSSVWGYRQEKSGWGGGGARSLAVEKEKGSYSRKIDKACKTYAKRPDRRNSEEIVKGREDPGEGIQGPPQD